MQELQCVLQRYDVYLGSSSVNFVKITEENSTSVKRGNLGPVNEIITIELVMENKTEITLRLEKKHDL